MTVLQKELVSHNYSVGAAGADGIFGNATKKAVNHFKRDYALPRDGIAGRRVWKDLALRVYCSSGQSVYYGTHGACVRWVQVRLNHAGAHIRVGGVFNSRTRNETIAYQRCHRLGVDGIAGPITRGKLAKRHQYSIWCGPNHTQRAVLTTDDCPRSLSQLKGVLKTVKRLQVALVMAPTGKCIHDFKALYGVDITVLMRQHGQYVINHSVNHPELTTLSYAGVLRELSAPGVVTNYGRPPYGDGFFTFPPDRTVAAAYAAKKMHPYLWTVDTNDWKGYSAAHIVRYVETQTHARDTVLMHMSHNAFYAKPMAQMVNYLNAHGPGVCRIYPHGTTPVRIPNHIC